MWWAVSSPTDDDFIDYSPSGPGSVRQRHMYLSDDNFVNHPPRQVDKVDVLEGSARRGQQNWRLEEKAPEDLRLLT